MKHLGYVLLGWIDRGTASNGTLYAPVMGWDGPAGRIFQQHLAGGCA